MATQKGRNWSSGDIVTAANLSLVERGVSAMAEEYTPTTWSNGDTVTAAALNNIEQGIANAGGGSSDFSTAEVTVVNNIDGDAMCFAATVVEPPVPVLPSTTTGLFNAGGNNTTTKTVILYKGNCDMFVETSGTLSGSGDVEIDHTNAYITGDCTITISDSSGGQVAGDL